MALPLSALQPFRYLFGGLSVASAVPLTGYEHSASHVDVVFRAGDHIPDAGPWKHEARRFKASPGRWFFTAEDGSRFLVQHGDDVTYEVPTSVGDSALAGHLLQPVFATVLLQRGLLPLHASAVEGDEGAIAFLGRPASGKSTVAAWMQAHGHGFVADDVCPIDVEGHPAISGGFTYQKLSVATMKEVGLLGVATPIQGDTRGRFRVRVRARPAESRNLACGYVLECREADAVAGVHIERLTGPSALEPLIAHTYRSQYLRGLGRLASHLEACARVAARVPIYRVSFSHDTCDIHTLGHALLNHLREG